MKEVVVDELIERMRYDMVHWPELYWVVRERYPDVGEPQRSELAVEAVLHLVEHRLADVGDVMTDPANGLLDVMPWPERGDALRARLRAEISACPVPPRLGDGFWMARTDRSA